MGVITLDKLNSYMTGTTVDPALGQLVVDGVNDYVAAQTGREWGDQNTEITGEEHNVSPVIYLKHQDVKEITQIIRAYLGDSRTDVIPTTSYRVEASGRLSLYMPQLGFRSRNDYLKIDYSYGGGSDVPADLTLAALSLAADYYLFAQDGQKEVSSEGIGSYRVTYATGENSAQAPVRQKYFGTIDSYRTIRL